MHICQAKQAYLDDLTSRGYAPVTISSYATAVIHLIKTVGDIDISDVTDHHIRETLQLTHRNMQRMGVIPTSVNERCHPIPKTNLPGSYRASSSG